MKFLMGLCGVLCVLALATVGNAQLADKEGFQVNRTPRIVNGQASRRGQFPYQALIFLNIGEGRQGLCGGSLISNQWILTAGHCVAGRRSFTVHLGALRTHNPTEEGRVVQTTNTSFLHPGYWRRFILNDIALIRLNEPVHFSSTIQTVPLPSRNNTSWFHGIEAIATGFGLQNTSDTNIAPILQWAPLQTIDNFVCYRAFGWIVLRPSVLCAVGNERQSACNGDSGGPLVNADGIQIGLTSFGSGQGCHLGFPSVFTRVTSYLGWIRHVTRLDV